MVCSQTLREDLGSIVPQGRQDSAPSLTGQEGSKLNRKATKKVSRVEGEVKML